MNKGLGVAHPPCRLLQALPHQTDDAVLRMAAI